MYIIILGELQSELHTDSSLDFAMACRSMHDLYSHMGALACSLVIQPAYIRCSTHIAMTLSHWEPSIVFSPLQFPQIMARVCWSSQKFRGGIVNMFFQPALLALADY